jgi:glycosyltransferase involved in cell wall biosynthesis
MSELHNTGKYDIAELATYGDRNDPRGLELPWTWYGVVPSQEHDKTVTQKEIDLYDSSEIHQFGGLLFEHACLKFKPDIVCDIRDYWMMEFQSRSPYRRCFKWAIMPTVDAAPQSQKWVDMYSSADMCLTYTDWAGDVLTKQSGGKIKYLGSSPPNVTEDFKPVEDRSSHREAYGIDPDCKIVGTVMRNQRRKLYPDLFKSFASFLDTLSNEDRRNYYLYCHVSYPDQGWDIPELLGEHNLSSNVLFSYKCTMTGRFFPSLFKGSTAISPFTDKYCAVLPSVKNGLSDSELVKVYNLFDVYVQYANSEGFGLPQVEAAACGVPVMSIDYSAMCDVVRKLNGFPLKPLALSKESETGCMRAIPDNKLLVKTLSDFFSMDNEQVEEVRANTLKAFSDNYSFEKSVSMWSNYFDSVQINENFENWKVPARIYQPEPKPEKQPQISIVEAVKWLIVHVLKEPERLNTYFENRLMRDLTYNSMTSTMGGVYANESSAVFDKKWAKTKFNFDIAYEEMANMAEIRNVWEKRRVEVMSNE